MLTDIILAALFGGAVCAVAQILIDKTSLTPARILVLIVVSGVFIGAVGLYEPLLEIFGAGVSLPLTGFGGAVAKGVKDAVDENGFFGILKGPISAMSAGVLTALLSGFVASLIFKSKQKSL